VTLSMSSEMSIPRLCECDGNLEKPASTQAHDSLYSTYQTHHKNVDLQEALKSGAFLESIEGDESWLSTSKQQ